MGTLCLAKRSRGCSLPADPNMLYDVGWTGGAERGRGVGRAGREGPKKCHVDDIDQTHLNLFTLEKKKIFRL